MHLWIRSSLDLNLALASFPLLTDLFTQVTLTSVRVSWQGLLQQAVCADQVAVKWWQGDVNNPYKMEKLKPTLNSFIVKDLKPLTFYTFRVST